MSAAYLANAAPAKSLDDQADELGRLLDVRVTLIAPDGNVLGDSEVSASQLSSLENHRSRPEVLQALQEGTGSAIRWSSTLNVEFIYVARRLDPYFLRLAMPLSEVDALIRDLRSQLALAIFIAVGLTVVFGYVVRGLISLPLRKNLLQATLNSGFPSPGMRKSRHLEHR